MLTQAAGAVYQATPGADSIQYVIQNAVDDPGCHRHQHQIASRAVPFIAGILGQMSGMAGRYAMAPAMWQRTPYHQMHMTGQRRGRPQVVAITVNIPAQLASVRRMAMLFMRRAVMVLMLVPRRWLAMHFALVLPQPLTLPLRAPLLLTRGVAMLRLLMVAGVLIVLVLSMRLAGRIGRRGCARS